MKIGTIGAGTVALAFARKALAVGHEVVLSSRHGPESLAGKIAELGVGALAAPVEEAASLDYVLLAFPGRMSRTHFGACRRGTVECSSMRQIRSANTVPTSCWPIWGTGGQAKW